MPAKPTLTYWDACVFLAYIGQEPDRFQTVSDLLDETAASDGKHKIVTSIVSRVEVAYVAQERLERILDQDIEQRIMALWNTPDLIETIECHAGIADLARGLLRDAMSSGAKLQPMDAIHLASAQWAQARELYTYDDRLLRLNGRIGCVICEPHVAQHRLPGLL